MSAMQQVLAAGAAASKTTLLMHMQDVGLTDVKGNTVQLFGGAARSAVRASSIHPYSAYFDGVGDYLTVASSTVANFTTDDFTVEAWVYVEDRISDYVLLDGGQPGSQRAIFYIGSTGALAFYGNGSSPIASATGLVTLSAWHHVAISVDYPTQRLFIDGALVATETTGAIYGSVAPVFIGRQSNGAFGQFKGYMADLRVSKAALYTAAFPAPTAMLTDI